jgi:hypothetical protein
MIACMSDTTTAADRDAKTGRFLTGNGGGGRKPGSRNKLGEAFIADLRDAWNEHGADALRRCATDEPGQFCKIVASLLPRDVNLNVGVGAADFATKFRTAMALLGNEPELRQTRRPLPNQPLLIEHDDGR